MVSLSFICHSSKDSRDAMRLALALEARGEKCWVAPRDIPAGASYPHEIMEGIKECSTFIILLSKDAVESQHILRELESAVNLRKRIVPLRVSGVVPGSAIEYLTASVQWIDVGAEELGLNPGLVAEKIIPGNRGALQAGVETPASGERVRNARAFPWTAVLALLCASGAAAYFLVQGTLPGFPGKQVPAPSHAGSERSGGIAPVEEPHADTAAIPVAVFPKPSGAWIFTVSSNYVIEWKMGFLDDGGGPITAEGNKATVNGEPANRTEEKTELSMSGALAGRVWGGTFSEKTARKTFEGKFSVEFSEEMDSFRGSLINPDGSASAAFFGVRSD